MGLNAEQIEELDDKHEDEYLDWEKVPAERRLHERRDIHVFLMLDKCFPDFGKQHDMVAGADHDEIYLGADPEDENTLTEEILVDMIRAGLRFDGGTGGFAMFV